jgi:hypothetical protein
VPWREKNPRKKDLILLNILAFSCGEHRKTGIKLHIDSQVYNYENIDNVTSYCVDIIMDINFIHSGIWRFH